ncbi:rod shape-determining protein RodA [Caldibacillus lycopersici]|uniref:Rod shape-determining protein RodA n=1 Tax=Perspicuibacillus lycopersici TaxID=1325689 RepID=A0AAE3LPN1_9BACI|nr:FtsW/RodA/SpoVE family cell cycle protein [Perspicuibacillus lycopersici]MCU9615146.1 rod shape-determining protein RodA [Perspicuibacillus lycopersici]
MENQKKVPDRFDWTLAFIIFLLFIVSIIAISSAQTSGQYEINFVKMQIFWYGVGAFIIAGSLLFDPDQYKKLTWILYGFGIFLLVALIFAPTSIAEPRNGAKSWFTFGPASIQPSEFMKTFLILAISRVIADHHQKFLTKTLKTDGWLLLKIGITTLVPLALILEQPDLGTGLVIIAITAGMVLVSGISWKIILPTFSVVAILGVTIISIMIYFPEFLKDHIDVYQYGRIYSWLDPYSYSSNEGYHLISSLQAIGSGEIFGKGYLGKEVYVMERHTDFVFSVIAEEFGFIGASLVISLFFLLIYHLIKIALESNTQFNAYICAGIISMTTFHVFQNIGMTIQVLPITGIPLPFISYGGSSLMGNMFAMGVIFSIRFYHKRYMFSTDKE